jgi:hypothetical protein
MLTSLILWVDKKTIENFFLPVLWMEDVNDDWSHYKIQMKNILIIIFKLKYSKENENFFVLFSIFYTWAAMIG